MAEHYTKSTVEASAWCAKCKTMTPHMVGGGRLGACKTCLARLEALPKQAPKPVQESLF